MADADHFLLEMSSMPATPPNCHFCSEPVGLNYSTVIRGVAAGHDKWLADANYKVRQNTLLAYFV
jgi:hypothetical protein